MACPQCCGIERVFDQKTAERELRRYQRKGPEGGTRLLIEALRACGVDGLSLLDIGGGIGAIQHELFRAGISAAMDVDASSSYLAAARSEAERLGHTAETAFHHGNFVELAGEIGSADIVTLDRVICCYPDMHALVSLSSERARRFYAVVFPRDGWLMQIGSFFGNLLLRLSRNQFRFFVHPTAEIEAILAARGFQRRYYRTSGLIWQVIVYARA